MPAMKTPKVPTKYRVEIKLRVAALSQTKFHFLFGNFFELKIFDERILT